MRLVLAALSRPLTVIVVLIAIIAGFFMAMGRMPIDIFPNLNLPVVYVAQPYGGMDPAQMEGLLTNYYEYHFLYINGIHHVESQEHPGHGPDEAVLPPRHQHGPGDGRDDRLRHPLAGLHAAGDRLAVHHPVRRRQRPGRLPGALERDQDDRRDPGPGAVQGPADVRQPARVSRPRPRSAATSARSSSASIPTGSGPTRCRPTRCCGADDRQRSAPRATSASAARCRSCRSTLVGRSKDLRHPDPARPGPDRLHPRRRDRPRTPPTSPPATPWSTADAPSTSS